MEILWQNSQVVVRQNQRLAKKTQFECSGDSETAVFDGESTIREIQLSDDEEEMASQHLFKQKMRWHLGFSINSMMAEKKRLRSICLCRKMRWHLFMQEDEMWGCRNLQ
ncbi:Uncharacterized protein Fot_38144 [Forsythia ovata]|uniref:Uncharacterized protein n=1 Tax=Forsythia ovata TaxID=205694 RepID=A0ABD1S137_9LAMI